MGQIFALISVKRLGDNLITTSTNLRFTVTANAGAAEEVPQEGRNYFPIDETADDEAGFRLPRLIDAGESDKTLDAGTFAIIVESSPEGRELEGGNAFIPTDNSAPNKAGFRLPLPR